jgi:NAD dependent epimerase/dehydratase
MNWAGCKVLVTGADGFLGSHLVERLVTLGADVRAFCFYNSNGSLGWLDGVEPEMKKSLDVRLGDIRDGAFVEESCNGIQIVFHLAALIPIPYSYKAPESFVDTNIKGTLNLLMAARSNNCRRVIHTSTSEVYGTPIDLPIKESHPLQAQSPYSATKIAADKLAEAFYCSFDLPVVTLRPFNTFGPRQSMRAVIPTILVQLLSGGSEVRLGLLEPRRDLTFVADTVEGFVRAAEVAGIEGQVIHLGTGRTVSIGELFETACRVLGVSARVRHSEERLRPDNSEVMVLLSDPSKAEKFLAWKASTSLEQGVKVTAAWVAKHLDRFEPERYYV